MLTGFALRAAGLGASATALADGMASGRLGGVTATGGGAGAAVAATDAAAGSGARAAAFEAETRAQGVAPESHKVKADATAADASDETTSQRFEERCTARKSLAATTLRSES
jgi:hypothetical protein